MGAEGEPKSRPGREGGAPLETQLPAGRVGGATWRRGARSRRRPPEGHGTEPTEPTARLGSEPPPRQPVRAGRARVRVPPRTHHSDGGHHVGGGARPAAGAAAGAGPAALPCRPPACRAAFLGRADVSGGGAPRTRLGAAPARPPGGRAGAGSPLRAPPLGPGAGPGPAPAVPEPPPAAPPVLPLPSPSRGAARPHPAPSGPRCPRDPRPSSPGGCRPPALSNAAGREAAARAAWGDPGAAFGLFLLED